MPMWFRLWLIIVALIGALLMLTYWPAQAATEMGPSIVACTAKEAVERVYDETSDELGGLVIRMDGEPAKILVSRMRASLGLPPQPSAVSVVLWVHVGSMMATFDAHGCLIASSIAFQSEHFFMALRAP